MPATQSDNTASEAVTQVLNSIADVARDIAATNKKIESIETEIAATKKVKEEGWQGEVAALRAELGQLRAKEAQLREERLLLLKREGQL